MLHFWGCLCLVALGLYVAAFVGLVPVVNTMVIPFLPGLGLIGVATVVHLLAQQHLDLEKLRKRMDDAAKLPRAAGPALLLLALTLTGPGCAQRGGWIYRAGPRITAETAPSSPLRLAVTPLKDAREDKNSNAFLVGLILPVGWAGYSLPDAASAYLAHAGYNSRPSQDLARATAEELKLNGLFSEVFYTERERDPGADLVLKGELRNSDYRGTLITYLPLIGSLLWLFGLPAGTANNHLDLHMEIVRVKTREALWRHDIVGDSGAVIGLYYNFASEFNGYPAILKKGLSDAIVKLTDDLAARPAFWGIQKVEAAAAP